MVIGIAGVLGSVIVLVVVSVRVRVRVVVIVIGSCYGACSC